MKILLPGVKMYLNVPYSMKDEVKKYGCRFDFEIKKWFIYSNNPKLKDFQENFTHNIFIDKIDDDLEKLELEELEKEFQEIINKQKRN